MPETVTGDIDFRSSGLAVRMYDDGRQIQLAVDSRNFGGRPLRAEFAVRRPDGHESSNGGIPSSDAACQFTSKQSAVPATGVVELGAGRIGIDGCACREYGRG